MDTVSRSARTTVAVIQVRMASKRLPGKALLPLAGAPLLQRLIERIERSQLIDRLIVATTDDPSDDPIADLCQSLTIDCHRGSHLDVLQRVTDAARRAGADVVVRLTGDNPFVSGDLIDMVVERFLTNSPPYVYAHNHGSSGFPFGLFVEVVTLEALENAAISLAADDREHVTLFLRRHPERFPSLTVRASDPFTLDSVTVDTFEQYQKVRTLFERLYRANPCFGFDALMDVGCNISNKTPHRVTGTK